MGNAMTMRSYHENKDRASKKYSTKINKKTKAMSLYIQRTNSDAFNSEALEEHNRLRSLHGCPPLHLDFQLCHIAQSFANQLAKERKLRHSMQRNLGENLAYKRNQDENIMTGKQVSLLWYSEIKDMTFGAENQIQSGHFSQVVWRSTKAVGFGIAYSDDGNQAFAVANYSPPGNFSGQWAYNVPPPISGMIWIPPPCEYA